MNATNEDYELVARYLDGEEVTLTAAQLALAEEVVSDARQVGRALEVPSPAGTLHRVHGRMVRDLRLASRLWRGVRWAAPVAAAAAVILAFVLLPGGPARPVPVPSIAAADYVDHFSRSPTQELDLRVDLLAEELADYHVRLVLNGSWAFEMAVAGVEEGMEDLLLGDEADAAPMLETWEESL